MKRKKADAGKADLLACMAYLHGDAEGDEFKAACLYEYARESGVLKRAASLRDSIIYLEIGKQLSQEFSCSQWFIQDPWRIIYECPSFPAKGWNQLTNDERENILHAGDWPYLANQPRLMMDIRVFDCAGGVLESLNILASNTRKARMDRFNAALANGIEPSHSHNRKPEPKVFPIHEGFFDDHRQPWYVHALFTIDFRKTPTQLRNDFWAWLHLPENEARFSTHKNSPTGKTGFFRDRLKDLASLRLERELGRIKAERFAQKHRLKDRDGKPRAFFGAWEGGNTPRNDAPLYAHDSHWSNAKERAEEYMSNPRLAGVF
jgi:hypothetical protein